VFSVNDLPPIRGIARTSPAFREAVKALAERVGAQPIDLFAVMSFETGGSFDPSRVNPLSGATGLIQFMGPTAEHLGTTTAAIGRMSGEKQLAYVERYLKPFRPLPTLLDLYMAVLWPAALHQGPDYVIAREGSAVYVQNRGLDLNHDGMLTAGEAVEQVRNSVVWPQHQTVTVTVSESGAGPEGGGAAKALSVLLPAGLTLFFLSRMS
jgi:hypothetical protein